MALSLCSDSKVYMILCVMFRGVVVCFGVLKRRYLVCFLVMGDVVEG